MIPITFLYATCIGVFFVFLLNVVSMANLAILNKTEFLMSRSPTTFYAKYNSIFHKIICANIFCALMSTTLNYINTYNIFMFLSLFFTIYNEANKCFHCIKFGNLKKLLLICMFCNRSSNFYNPNFYMQTLEFIIYFGNFCL
jgi:hypothetical protein